MAFKIASSFVPPFVRILGCSCSLWGVGVGAAMPAPLLPMTLRKTAQDGFLVEVGGKPFAAYVVDQANKPYLGPVYGPTGKEMTRRYPMQDVEGEQKDHPHHRAITFGHESVGLEAWQPAQRGKEGAALQEARGGGDTWHEELTFRGGSGDPKAEASAQLARANVARIVHKAYDVWREGPEGIEVGEVLEHVDRAGRRFLTEHRRLHFGATQTLRWIDFDQDLVASDGALRFDDRKDSGLSIRVASSMAVDRKQGGRILNGEGLTDEAAWGKPAKWCDYSGPVEGEMVGVAMFSHPATYRFPDRWHVRSYGLFTANPFGRKQLDAKETESPVKLAAGEKLSLRHRFVFHAGEAHRAETEALYERYAQEAR